MEMGKQGISISKDLNEEINIKNRMMRIINVDDEEEEEDNENVGVGRTYECSYCKRGFTNAQALGGHMNIHRKDKAKAKAKQHPTFSSLFDTSSSCSSDSIVSKKPEEGEFISTFSSTLVPQMGKYHVYNYDPLANPRPRSTLSQPSTDDYYGDYKFSLIRRRSSTVNTTEEDLGSDLSLRINSSSSRTNHQAEEEKKNDDVDLELRLGYD